MASKPTDANPPKRPTTSPSNGDTSPSKRLCITPSSSFSSMTAPKPTPSIQSIIHMPGDAIWSLRKEELRRYFLLLQSYAQNPYPIEEAPTSSTPIFPSQFTSLLLPAFLKLPLEIRNQIYIYTLPPPRDPDSPIPGPHPRQLQNALKLTQSITPSLLLLNHQIRAEALPILFGSPGQMVHITIDHLLWKHKTSRSPLIMSSALVSALKHLHIHFNLGSEKGTGNRKSIDEIEKKARTEEVKKGIKKLAKWLRVSGARIESLKVSWQEPRNCFVWETKREILEMLRGIEAERVSVGVINWGLGDWNKGKRFRFEEGFLEELEKGWENYEVRESLHES